MEEKLLEMLKMQEALDNAFMKANGLDKLEIDKVQKALFDECGEVNHELKAQWCYWKKTQAPVNRDKLKEELSDVWHFALSLHRLYNGMRVCFPCLYNVVDDLSKRDWFWTLKDICCRCNPIVLYKVYALTEKLGFTFDEIYEGYIEKNKINYERIKNGY